MLVPDQYKTVTQPFIASRRDGKPMDQGVCCIKPVSFPSMLRLLLLVVV